MELIDGNRIAGDVLEELSTQVSAFPSRPCVTFVRVGEDPASVSYVRKKEQTADRIGVEANLLVFPDSISQTELLHQIDLLNQDSAVHGILIQSPLPGHIDETVVFNHVHPSKDVDGFSATNLGLLCQQSPRAFRSCTPLGIVELIQRSQIGTSGKHVVVLGRSLIVGKPVGMLLLNRGYPGDSTVTYCHSKTPNLADFTQQADILIAAIGKPAFVHEGMVKSGCAVIDVGINRVKDSQKKSGYRLVGDVDFDAVSPKCAHITPVPGGVGPMTVAMLMSNTIQAYRQLEGVDPS
jgi:methylenetetrahydrofolate dehydrogenase (NADP+)/methenyltetrahydrofolate cyclohydrolase